MTAYQEKRCVDIAIYMLKNQCTVRNAACAFGISKSTVHTYMSKRLKTVDGWLYKQVRNLLNKNKAERHIRGGMATKRKYKK